MNQSIQNVDPTQHEVPSILAEQEKKAKKNAVKKVVLLIVAIIVVVAIVLIIIGSKQIQSTPAQSASTETAESSSTSQDAAPSSLDFIGSWKCSDWDQAIDGKTVISEAVISFEEDGYLLQYIGQLSGNSNFATTSTYILSNGELAMANGDWLTKGKDETLVYHVAEANQG